MPPLPYDVTSRERILQHGRKLLGHSLREIHPNATSDNVGRGGLGQAVERFHFNYRPNSEAAPDFAEAGLELKCSPLKELADGSTVAKERLVLNIINYLDEAGASFRTSSFWKKRVTPSISPHARRALPLGRKCASSPARPSGRSNGRIRSRSATWTRLSLSPCCIPK